MIKALFSRGQCGPCTWYVGKEDSKKGGEDLCYGETFGGMQNSHGKGCEGWKKIYVFGV
jgi:hypothetical protein